MCRDTLAGTGKRVLHVLDLIFPTTPIRPDVPTRWLIGGWPGALCRQCCASWEAKMRRGDGRAPGGTDGAPHIRSETAAGCAAPPRRRMVTSMRSGRVRSSAFPLGRFLASLRPRMAAFWVSIRLWQRGLRVTMPFPPYDGGGSGPERFYTAGGPSSIICCRCHGRSSSCRAKSPTWGAGSITICGSARIVGWYWYLKSWLWAKWQRWSDCLKTSRLRVVREQSVLMGKKRVDEAAPNADPVSTLAWPFDAEEYRA